MNVSLYEEPDIIPFADREVLKELTDRVKKNPNYPLPDGYYKVKEKEVVYDYGIQEYQGVSESVIVALEVLEEFIFAKFGIHTIEGVMRFEESWKVKPKLKKNLGKEIDPYLALNKLGPKKSHLRPLQKG